MNRIRHIAAALAALTATVAVFAATGTAAFATQVPPLSGADNGAQAPVRVIAGGGMPGWQITLIAVVAALFAAVLAVLLDRAFAARRRTTANA
jgi:hypothetical protein